MDIVKCGHALCLSCVDKGSNNKPRGRKQDNKDYQICCSTGCYITYSKLSAQRFMEKINEIFIMVSGSSDKKTVFKETFVLYITLQRKVFWSMKIILNSVFVIEHFKECNRLTPFPAKSNHIFKFDIIEYYFNEC